MTTIANGMVQIGANNNTNNTTQSDTNIFPVGKSIDASSCIYDNQTIVMVNSSVSQSANTIKGTYFDPIMTNGWNFDMGAQSFLNGVFSESALMSESTSSYLNLQPQSPSSLGKYTIDITNGMSDGTGVSTEFFSLTSNPYACVAGSFTNGSGIPTYNNINPNYSNSGSDSFIFTSNYYFQQKNEILMIQLIFTVQNTGSLNVATTSTTLPRVTVLVINKVVTQDAMSGISNGFEHSHKTKTYTSTPYTMDYQSTNGPPGTFNPQQSYNYIKNTLPIVFAPGFVSLYATLPLSYVPPVMNNSVWYGQYVNTVGNGFNIISGEPTFNTTTGLTAINRSVSYGHFVVAVSYNQDGYSNSYVPNGSIYAEYLIRNIWRSPISIFNSYEGASVSDMVSKKVILLFGTTSTGGMFFVMNTGTPINVITGYAVTTLSNFMQIIRALKTNYNGQTSYMSYLTDQNVINQLNASGYFTIVPVQINKITEGTITNPSIVKDSPGMYYMLVNSTNSVNFVVDPSEQNVLNKSIGIDYLNMGTNCTLMTTGVCRYNNSNLKIEQIQNGDLLGNSFFMGLRKGSSGGSASSTYFVQVILPETLFNGKPIQMGPNQMGVFANVNSPFYIKLNGSAATQFSPDSNLSGNRVTLSVSNTQVTLGDVTS